MGKGSDSFKLNQQRKSALPGKKCQNCSLNLVGFRVLQSQPTRKTMGALFVPMEIHCASNASSTRELDQRSDARHVEKERSAGPMTRARMASIWVCVFVYWNTPPKMVAVLLVFHGFPEKGKKQRSEKRASPLSSRFGTATCRNRLVLGSPGRLTNFPRAFSARRDNETSHVDLAARGPVAPRQSFWSPSCFIFLICMSCGGRVMAFFLTRKPPRVPGPKTRMEMGRCILSLSSCAPLLYCYWVGSLDFNFLDSPHTVDEIHVAPPFRKPEQF